jgi:protein LTV1
MSKAFNKTNSVKFQLVHRSHQDSKYYDTDASSSVLVPIIDKNQQRKEFRAIDAEDLAADVANQLSKDEGKASNYGITFDDSEYDYLQHLKPIGSGQGVFISKKENPKEIAMNKNKKLSTLLANIEMLPGEEIKYDYQTQQDVPDEIKGFKPDLNPDLREALVALEDENYLDQNQDIDEIDVFDELLGGNGKKHEISLRDYDQYDDDNYNDTYYDDDYQDNDWDYDNFDDAEYEFEGVEGSKLDEPSNFNWEKDFAKFKKTQGRKVNEFDSDNEFDGSDEDDDDDDLVGDLPNIGEKGLKSSNTKSSKKKAKRKKGATTDTSSYSMSSSALCRTEQMTIIDDKFDILKEQYDNMDDEDEDNEYQPFDLANERDDFMDLVDDFLDNYQLEKRGRRVVKKNEEMEKYREAAMSVTKDNSRVKNRNNIKKGDSLINKMDKLSI